MVSTGDVVEAREKESTKKRVQQASEIRARRPLPEWLAPDGEAFKVTVLRPPRRDEIAVMVNESAVIGLYSK
jgi:ribosomal protein S4